jgi:hypothetical protein
MHRNEQVSDGLSACTSASVKHSTAVLGASAVLLVPLSIAKVIRINSFKLVRCYGSNTYIIVYHQLCQTFSVNQDNLMINTRYVCLSLFSGFLAKFSDYLGQR